MRKKFLIKIVLKIILQNYHPRKQLVERSEYILRSSSTRLGLGLRIRLYIYLVYDFSCVIFGLGQLIQKTFFVLYRSKQKVKITLIKV